MNDYNFGNFVCRLREEKGLTQADLAGQLGVTPAAISKWETGSAKPRVEVLFQLAAILSVRPEELMAGRYLEDEHLDPESVQLINEKYEHLRRIELHNTTKTKIFRLIAWLIDWNAIGFAVWFAVLCLVPALKAPGETASTPLILLVLLLILSVPVCFVLRDLIFGGRSLGKRILGLTVLDKKTGEAPKKSALFVRNLFFFLYQIDGVIMLVTGLTLGDRAAGTVVIRKKDLDLSREVDVPTPSVERINRYVTDEKERAKSNKRQAVMWICLAAVAAILFIGSLLIIILSSLNDTKDTEEYQLAYSYVIESEAWKKTGFETDKLKYTTYSLSSGTDSNGVTQRDAEIGFRINFWNTVTVILHDEGDGWYVCRDCTGFE